VVGLWLAACGTPLPHSEQNDCQSPGPPGSTRALLIGVSDYDQADTPSGWPDLRSDVDLQRMRATTTALGIERVCVLEDHAATATGIRAALDDALLPAVQAGDHLLLFYAGHGTALPDTNGDEADGQDEALAPFGAAPSGPEGTLTDDDLSRSLAQLRSRAGSNGSVVVVVDACHSGTITRGADAARAPVGESSWVDDAEGAAPLVVFAAARDAGLATEGLQGGRLTRAWSDAMLSSHQPRTWGNIASDVQLRVGLSAAGQEPVFSGPPGLGMFGGPSEEGGLWTVHAVDDTNRLTLSAGGLHGLRSGDRVHAEGLPDGRVLSVSPVHAKVQLDAAASPAQLARARFTALSARRVVYGLEAKAWTDATLRVAASRTGRDAACRPSAPVPSELGLGDRYGVRLEAGGDRPVWVTVFLTDSTGHTQALWPRDGDRPSLLVPGRAWDLPICLEAIEPVGVDQLLVLATDLPVEPNGLLGTTTRGTPQPPSVRGWLETLDIPVQVSHHPEQ